MDGDQAPPLRLAAAGEDRSAWITLLTTEHYNLQTQRVATIAETNGRAGVFLSSMSSGLVALGFAGQDERGSPGFVAFALLVLSALVFLGVVTFARTVQASIDDALFARRIDALRDAYAQLVPDLVPMLTAARGQDVYRRRVGRRSQRLLTVSGSVGVLTGLLAGGEVGLLVNAGTASVVAALAGGAVVGLVVTTALMRSQDREWRAALADFG